MNIRGHYIFYSRRIFRPRLFKRGEGDLSVSSARINHSSRRWKERRPFCGTPGLFTMPCPVMRSAFIMGYGQNTGVQHQHQRRSPLLLFVNTTDIFFSALLLYLAACCQTQTQGRLLEDNMTDSLFIVCLTHRLSFMCTSMEPSGCRLFSMSPSKLVYAPLNQIPPMLTLDFMCLY